ARDAAGNTTTADTTFAVGASEPPAPADTTPPTVAIDSPSPNMTVRGAVNVAGSASDNSQVAKVEVSVDFGAYQTAQGTTSWSTSVGTVSLANGSHKLNARATDVGGNVTTSSETITVANDTTPPSVSFNTPASGASVSGSVSVSGAASDDVAVAKVELSVDGG